MSTPEGRVKARVKKALDKLGAECWRFMPVQTGFGAPALDFLLTVRGHFVAIETKAPGKKLTPLQETTKAAIEAAGGIVLVVWDESTLEIAMKIILALEFAPRADDIIQQNYSCLSAVGLDFHAVGFYPANSEAQRANEKYGFPFKPAQAAHPSTGGHHGAPGAAPKRRAK